MKNLLVVVDMVNGFVNEGALADKRINRIVPTIEKLIIISKQKNFDIVAFKDCHSKNDIEFKEYPPHCIKGTRECELVPELKKYENFMKIIEKPTTNGFNTQKFKQLIASSLYNNVFVCGCCTDICVKNFVISLNSFFKKNNINTNIVIITNGVDTFNAPNHNANEVNNLIMQELRDKGIKLMALTTESLDEKIK